MSEKRRQTFLAPHKPQETTINTERVKKDIEFCKREIALDKTELERHEKTLNNLIRLWKNSMTEKKRDKLYELQSYITFYEKDIENYEKLIKRLEKGDYQR